MNHYVPITRLTGRITSGCMSINRFDVWTEYFEWKFYTSEPDSKILNSILGRLVKQTRAWTVRAWAWIINYTWKRAVGVGVLLHKSPRNQKYIHRHDSWAAVLRKHPFDLLPRKYH